MGGTVTGLDITACLARLPARVDADICRELLLTLEVAALGKMHEKQEEQEDE